MLKKPTREWLDGLRVGDEVMMQFCDVLSVRTIDRTTLSLVISDGYRFRRSDGRMVGSGKWAIYPIDHKALSDQREERELFILRYRLRELVSGWKAIEPLSKIQLVRILQIINEGKTS